MNTTTEIIAKEGWKYIGIAFLLSVLFFIMGLNFLAFLLLLIMACNLFLFRNPEREPSSVEDSVVTSPIDGVVNSITQNNDFNIIKINHSFLDTHILRSPIKMNIEKSKKRNGLFLNSNSRKAEKLNETYEIFANTKFGEIIIKLMPSQLSRNISFFNKDEFNAGARFGILMDGFLELHLPKSIQISSEVGDKVIARNSIIAKFNKEDSK